LDKAKIARQNLKEKQGIQPQPKSEIVCGAIRRYMERRGDDLAIAQSVKAFLLKKFPRARQKHFEVTTPLLESGIVDSLGILELVGFLESEFGITATDEDLTPENFQSIEGIENYVLAKRSAC
jgi:acyl carrier protein